MSDKPTFTVPLSRVTEFRKLHPHTSGQVLRYGQAFYNYMDFNKMTSAENRGFLDRLHAADGDKAVKMIESIIDYEN